MKKVISGIFALLTFTSLCAFADGTVEMSTTISTQAKQTVEKMRGLDMRQGPTLRDDLSTNPIEEYRQRIIAELRSEGNEAVPALVQALHDPDFQMRCNSELVMIFLAEGFDGKPKVDISMALPDLIKLTDDTNSNVRAWAAYAIAAIGPSATNAIPALIKLLNDPDAGSRNCSCIALGVIGPAAKDALPALQKALKDSDPDVRKFAKHAIQKISG